ncbi:MAG TPA: HEAT repeat domain-containing protein [Verrucomicrobiales bacterium]|nr:HEAT repeat domain-containing protein [Verrucomicrobiales bacterium]
MATASEIAALVAQMPDTDREIENREKNPDPTPSPGTPAPESKFTGPAPAQAEATFTAILAGGRAGILHLLDLVRAPSDPGYTNDKAGYVLHGLCLHTGKPGMERERRALAGLLAERLDHDGASQAVKASFIRELQRIGAAENAPALGRRLLDPELGGDAAQALLAIREGAVDQFRSALRSADGASTVHLIQALGALQDSESAPALRPLLEDQNQETQLIVAWALANIGDPEAIEPLLALTERAEGWGKTRLTAACRLLAQRLSAAGRADDAARVTQALEDAP